MNGNSRPAATLLELLEHDAFMRTLARSLVADEGRADDVVQDAYVAALQRPPRHPGPLGGWLASIVRHIASKLRRGEARRAFHEQRVDPVATAPSSETILAREEARRRVVKAVLELDEPYRATVLLRHFEQMAPPAIAKRFGIPVETVRTRLKRALEKLRSVLDSEYGGDRGAWCLTLLPFAKAAPVGAAAAAAASIAAVATTISAGVFVMSVKAKVASLALMTGGVVLTWVFLHHDEDRSGSTRAPASVAKASPSLPAPAGAAAPESVPPTDTSRSGVQRDEIAPDANPAAAKRGSLRVKVVWEEDHSPAKEVGVVGYVSGRADPYVFTLNGVTDSSGACRFDDVEPGNVLVVDDHGSMGNGARAKVLPGQVADVTITIPAGVNVDGVVVDESAEPFAGAEIWLGPDGANARGGRVVATSDEHGKFTLRSIGGVRYIGARAAGCVPSLLKTIEGQAGATRSLQLSLRGPGGTVAGRVVDPDGRPVAHARLLLGDEEARNDPPAEEQGMPYQLLLGTETDERGEFEFSGTMLGTLPLGVRARGFAPWQQMLDVTARASTDVDVRLERGATLEGRVTNSDGSAVRGAFILVGRMGRFSAASTKSAADGSYRLAPIIVGAFDAVAEGEGAESCKASLVASAGETLRWDPVMKRGLELRGRVIDEDGHGLEGFHILVEGAAPDTTRGWFMSFGDCGPDGRFAISGCPDADLHLRVTFPSGAAEDAAELAKVRAGGKELEIRIPRARLGTSWIEGTVVGADHLPPANVNISVFSAGSQSIPIQYPDHRTGSFKVGPYPPGDFRIIARAEGYPETEFVVGQVEGNTVKNVGTLMLARGGRLQANVKFTTAHDGAAITASCTLLATGRPSPVVFDGTTATTRELAPGTYRLRIEAPDCAPAIELVSVRSEETTRVEVTLVPAIRVTLQVPLPDDVRRRLAEKDAAVSMQIIDSRDESILIVTLKDASERFTTVVGLAPGKYRLSVTDGDVAVASSSFEILESQRPAATIDVVLH